MKKLIAGIALMVAGVLMEGFTFIAGAGIAVVQTGWNTEAGRFWWAVSDNGLLGFAIISGIVAVIGLIITLANAFGKDNK
jgi:hypothetical protein